MPHAALSPFNFWIMPRRHVARFSAVTDEELLSFATILRRSLRRLHFGLGSPDFNVVIQGAPI